MRIIYDILFMSLTTRTARTIEKTFYTLPATELNPTYQSHVRKFNTWLDGRPVNSDTVSLFIEEMKRSHRPATVKNYKAALKKAIADARGMSLTLAEAAQLDALFKKLKTAQPERKVYSHEILTESELKELVEIAGEKPAAIVRALYDTAARVSELLNVKLSNCRHEKGFIVCPVVGKGGKERKITMRRQVFDSLRKIYNGKKYLIENKGKPLSRIAVFGLVKRAGAKIGRPDIHPHTFRHSKATHLLKGKGMTLPAVSATLGHADGATTARYYLHDTPAIGETIIEV